MIRFIFFFLQLVFLIAIVGFITSNPFIISLDIKNLKYSFSSNFFAIVFITTLLILYITTYLFFRSRFSIYKFLLKNKYNKIEKGYFHFVDAMIAIANKDNRKATKSHKKMISYLKNDPSLSLLLKAEVYKIEKKIPELNNIYETMIKSKKTEALGYRGLMEQNLNNQDYHHAFLYGEKLFNLNPFTDKLYETLVNIIAKTKNWNQLVNISEKAYKKNIITKDLFYENKSIALYEIAKIQSNNNLKEANNNIIKALDLKRNFQPYIKLHLELISKLNNLSYLRKMIKKYWYLNPNSILRSILIKVMVDNKINDLNFIYQVIKNDKNNEESKKMLIYFAIVNQDWKVAKDSIAGLIGPNPSKEICLFMAKIELGENNDKQKSDSWIMRSESLIDYNTWTCRITNKTQEEWSSLSDSGYFNSLVVTNLKMIENIN